MKLIPILLLIGVIAIIFIIPRTDEDEARRILESNGFSDIEFTGYSLWMAGRDDWYSTGFIATSPAGNRVEGSVTGSPLKGSTLRFK